MKLDALNQDYGAFEYSMAVNTDDSNVDLRGPISCRTLCKTTPTAWILSALSASVDITTVGPASGENDKRRALG